MDHGVNGLLVPAGHVTGLSNAISTLAVDRATRSAMGLAAIAAAEAADPGAIAPPTATCTGPRRRWAIVGTPVRADRQPVGADREPVGAGAVGVASASRCRWLPTQSRRSGPGSADGVRSPA